MRAAPVLKRALCALPAFTKLGLSERVVPVTRTPWLKLRDSSNPRFVSNAVCLADRSIIDGVVAHWHNLPIHTVQEIGMPTRNVVLTDYQASFVERLVRTGRYQNASEVLREGLRMVEQREAEDASRLEALRTAVKVGSADFEQGRYVTFESGAQLEGHLASLAAKTITGT